MRENLKPMFRNWPAWTLRVLLITILPFYLVLGIIVGMRELLYSWSREWYNLRSL